MANDEYADILVTKRLEIVKSLNCERTFLLNHLMSKHVFDTEDRDLILAEKTNDARAGKLVDFLVKKGPEAFQFFLDVVQVENAALYESLTGVKSTSRQSPLMPYLEGTEPKGEGVCSYEIQLLIEHQKRIFEDLQDISLKYSELLQSKQALEDRLIKANQDLQIEKERREVYESRIEKKLIDEESLQQNEFLAQECGEMEKGIADRDVYIIVLQMKLLAEKEESEKLRTKVSELEHKHENMARDLRRMSENYNHERCQSHKLSECIRLQVDEIQKNDELKKRLRESQYQNILMREERDCITKELTELKKWAEALKTRFDVVEKEKFDSIEKNEFVTTNCVNLQESVRNEEQQPSHRIKNYQKSHSLSVPLKLMSGDFAKSVASAHMYMAWMVCYGEDGSCLQTALQRKLSLSELETEELTKRNELLSKDCEIYKKQRDCALDARKESILDRDKALSDRDAIQKQYNELQTKRDKMNEERAVLMQDYSALEIRYKTTFDDLGKVKRELNERILEVGDLTRLLNEAEEKNRSRNSRHLDVVPTLPPTEASDGGMSPETVEESESDDHDDTGNPDSPWRERRLKSLLKSMKVRIAGERSEDDIARDPVSPACGNMTLEVLQYLLPNLSSRPYSLSDSAGRTPVTRSLQRQWGIRKQKRIQVTEESSNNPMKARTMPHCAQKEKVDFVEDAEKPLEIKPTRRSMSSPPDITVIQDIDGLPPNFRDRTQHISNKIRRCKSTDVN